MEIVKKLNHGLIIFKYRGKYYIDSITSFPIYEKALICRVNKTNKGKFKFLGKVTNRIIYYQDTLNNKMAKEELYYIGDELSLMEFLSENGL